MIALHSNSRHFCLLSLLGWVPWTDTRLTDYSHSNYIPILDGTVIVWNETTYIRHSSNLTDYKRYVQETIELTETFPLSHMRKILKVDTSHIRTLLTTLGAHKRHARSINFLGSALKVIAGTPDADDLLQTRLTEQELIRANNRQIEINSRTQEQINSLTSTVNQILNVKKREEIDTAHLYETLLTRNRILTLEIQNLMIAITLAKVNVVNPAIIDSDDLEAILSKSSAEVSVTQLFSAARVKVLADDEVLSFVISFPRPKITCKKIVIFPVAHAGRVLHLTEDVVAECPNGVTAVSSCVRTPTTTFCRETLDRTCAQGLHAGTEAHCGTKDSDLPPVSIIDEGILVVNDALVRVSLDDEPEVSVNGTYLVTFERMAYVNNTKYVNLSSYQKRVPLTAASARLNVTYHHSLLSLPFLHRLSEENLQRITELRTQVVVNPVAAVATCSIVGVVAICILAIRRLRRRKRTLEVVQQALENVGMARDDHVSKGGSS